MPHHTSLSIIFCCILLSACAGFASPTQGPTSAPWDPQPSDSRMQRGEVELTSVKIITLESDPPQFRLSIRGALPTPCHQLRVVVSQSSDSSRIDFEVYSVFDPDEICIQVLEPFAEEIPIGVLSSRESLISVNGNRIGEIKP
ncbi:MAG: hypothetical protein IMY85_10580 [Chloroflexi bacterium]|nr:hypothetical protein [Chloroflexota bacterium]